MTNLLSDFPTSYAKVENISRLVGIKSDVVMNAIVSSNRLRPLLDIVLTSMMGEMSEMSAEDQKAAELIISLGQKEFHEVSRIVALLTQASVIRGTMDGKLLSTVVEFAGNQDILKFIRNHDTPTFSIVPPTTDLSLNALQSSLETIDCFLMGLLPRNFQVRVLLAWQQDQLRGALEVQSAEDREALQSLLHTAMILFKDRAAQVVGDTGVLGVIDA